MKHLNIHRLGATLDSVAESLFYQGSLPKSISGKLARWIAGRQGLPGAYAGTFAPTQADLTGIRLFTGEALRTRAGISHVLGEESCRILGLLKVDHSGIQRAWGVAIENLAARIQDSEEAGTRLGFYCCGPCTLAYWRNLAAGLLPRPRERLRAGLALLKELRIGNGQWRRFPFFYTCLVLTEIEPGLAKDEIQYAALTWPRKLKRLVSAKDPWSRRRAEVGRRLLALAEK